MDKQLEKKIDETKKAMRLIGLQERIRKRFPVLLEDYERSLCRFKEHFPEAQKIHNFRVYLYHYNFEPPGKCLQREFEIFDFIKEYKVNSKLFPEEFKKFKALQCSRKQFFKKYEKEIVELLKEETKVMINGYSTYLDYLDENEPEEMSDMLGIRTHLFYLLKYFLESGIDAVSFQNEIERLDDCLKSDMEDFVLRYSDCFLDHSRPIDHSQWWLFMDRIVAEKKKREMALIPTDDENEEEEP